MSLDKDYLQGIAREIDKRLPDNHGFILLTFPFGEDPGRRCSYVSNAERASAVNALKEWLLSAGYAEDWMKHIE